LDAAPAEFFYDAQGRLVGVREESGNMAVHRYDPVGNLLSIDNFSQTAGNVGIFLLLPEKGVIGETIDIEGFGFSNVSTENTVTFNGTAATVVSSTFDTLTVTVPVGATTGPIVVSNTTGTAGPKPFTILTTPTIFSIAPEQVAQGTTTFAVISGVNMTNVIGVTFSIPGLTANILSGATSSSIPINIIADATVLPGTDTFIVTTANGILPGVSVSVSLGLLTHPISKDISVFLPGPSEVGVTGDAFSLTPTPDISVFLPGP
jgi:YD repeat-containing protein